MKTVDDIIAETIRIEGGFVNNPADPGGATKYGITQKAYSTWLKRPATVQEVKDLDIPTATEIYKVNYYYGPRLNLLPDDIEPQLFDMGVNHGPTTAIRILQQTLNLGGFECSVDGVLGPKSADVCGRAYAAMGGFLINAVEEAREYFYQSIVARKPSQGVFLEGWLNRARLFRVDVDGT